MAKKIDIRFLVSSDIYHLKIDDLSCWSSAKDKPAVIEITLPGSNKPIRKYFPQETVVYDSNSLFNDCYDDCDELVELPDGIYNIKLMASPSSFNYEVKFAKLDVLQKKLDLAYIKDIDKDCKSCDKKHLIEFEFTKRLIESLVRNGDENKASHLYSTLIKKIEKVIKCKDC